MPTSEGYRDGRGNRRRHVGRGRVAVVILVALSMLGSGCTFFFDDTPIVVVGDSILFMSTSQVETTLAEHDWEPTVEGHSGASIRGINDFVWAPRLEQLVAQTGAKTVVVELGTNDCQTPCDTSAEIDQIMTVLKDVPHVYWLNVRVQAPQPRDPEVVNADLRAAATRWRNLEIVDMNAWFLPHPDWILPDGIHPTPAGQQGLADLIQRSVGKG